VITRHLTPILGALLKALLGTALLALSHAAAGEGPQGDTPSGDISPWAVDAPGGYPAGSSREVSFTARHGHMSGLDVSPDGRMIIFELLGDIYKMPVTGGTATAVTSGLAWDTYPRFSPDGQHIAFLSDRSGNRALWTMDRTGSGLTAVPGASGGVAGRPAWTPDGQFLAVTQYAGHGYGDGDRVEYKQQQRPEVWLYSKNGGRGLPLSNAGLSWMQPAFSPDGSTVYGTARTNTDNPDSPSALQILRLDRSSGHRTPAAHGLQAATSAATPSPDGRYLAFWQHGSINGAQRSALAAKDLTSGEITILDTGLAPAPDMVNGTALDTHRGTIGADMSGLIAWLPDSSAVLYGAGGKIWRAEIGGSAAMPVAFTVTDSRRIIAASPPAISLGADRFTTRAARFVALSPDRSKLVFETLGKLYVKIGDGAPARLTRDNGPTFELYPVFAPDGKTIYFTTWHDRDHGSIRRIAAKPLSRATIMTREKGHYRELAISEDGKTLLVRKAAGGGLMPSSWAQRPGIYTVATLGGAMTYVSHRGTWPHFAGGRIFASERQTGTDGTQTALISMTAQGLDIRTHATSGRAAQMQVAPGGGQIAFTQDGQLYLSPLPDIPGPVRIDALHGDMPAKAVSTLGAVQVGFSRTGKHLFWMLGNQLSIRSIDSGVTDTAGTVGTAPDTKTMSLSLSMPIPVPKGAVALTGARIITGGDGGGILDGGTVLITGNRIEAIGPAGTIAIPPGTARIDMTGKTIIPGLIVTAIGTDTDTVMGSGDTYRIASGDVIPQHNPDLLTLLRRGVTTVHMIAAGDAPLFAAADYADSGVLTAPRILPGGTVQPVSDFRQAQAHVDRLQRFGAVSVAPRLKFGQKSNWGRAPLQMLAAAARQQSMLAVMPLDRLKVFHPHSAMTAAIDGYAIPVPVPAPALVGPERAPNTYLAGSGALRQTAGLAEGETAADKANDAWLPALYARTLGTARTLGIDPHVGSIAAGKLADLVILDATLSGDIAALTTVSAVMVGGRLYDLEALTPTSD